MFRQLLTLLIVVFLFMGLVGCKSKSTTEPETDPFVSFVDPDDCHYILLIIKIPGTRNQHLIRIDNEEEDFFTASLSINGSPITLSNVGDEDHDEYTCYMDLTPGQKYNGSLTVDGTTYNFSIRVTYPIENLSVSGNQTTPTITWALDHSNMHQFVDGSWQSNDDGYYFSAIDSDARMFTFPNNPYETIRLYNINLSTYNNNELGVYSYSIEYIHL